jgi:DNA-binding transcriptional LysR family regulator
MRPEFLDARQLEALKAVVDSGSITKAALQIGKSQSAVTRLIQDLELELGYSVLDRKGPRVHPTQSGIALCHEAEQYLRGLAAVSRGGRSAAHLAQGLSIATISALSTSIVPDAISDVAEQVGHMPISVVVDNSEMVTKAVLDHKADIGLIGFAPDTPGIQFQWIAEVPFVAMVHNDHPLAQKDVITHSDLAGWDLITASGRYRLQLMFERVFNEHDIEPRRVIVSNASHVSISLSTMPNAVALVQLPAAMGARSPDLRIVPLGFFLPFHFGVITAVGAPLNTLDISLIDRLEQRASQLQGYRKCDAFPGFGQPVVS